ncbi:HAD-IA family hydrolase [Kutzneria albida]|uniref:Sugar-phosphatase n=1 Tax=Kutzneria albida DSM 43870 TaxID=1449976 RepID=W5WJG5_9PSEU|nr:HAD-IA family hydrolase [Kutzneria albida]AHI01018.1 hypothetical protein KALB_7660 [Kutzneria albida DSM 43870]
MICSVQALLFDMDGTLVDSTAVVERAWRRFARRHDLDFAEIMASAHGRRSSETIRQHLPDEADIAGETARIDEEELADLDGILAVHGAADLLARLPADRWALVTSASLELATRRMAAAGLDLPPTVVTAEDVSLGKPDPQGYLLGARRLGVAPSQTLVFEDADAGLLAGLAAGASVVAVGGNAGAAAEGLVRVKDFREVQVTVRQDGLEISVPGWPTRHGS